jgi:hypothetical protein
VTMVPFSDSIASSFGTAVISFDFASVAIWRFLTFCWPVHLQRSRQLTRLCSSELRSGQRPNQA